MLFVIVRVIGVCVLFANLLTVCLLFAYLSFPRLLFVRASLFECSCFGDVYIFGVCDHTCVFVCVGCMIDVCELDVCVLVVCVLFAWLSLMCLLGA